jgi:1-deoxy-D-xylulose-5-phosphate synthase
MIYQIPKNRPHTPILNSVESPYQLRKLPKDRLPELAQELRSFLLYSVGRTGGHFGAGLGVVELTIALHYLFDTPDDRVVWDVGHQAYPHKILTGRRDLMDNLRKKGGVHPFPCRSESNFDTFGVGHSSTSISAALGMAVGSKFKQTDRRVVAVIGDGALTAGMAYEAINHAADINAKLIVILNDNDMSISRNVGGISNYLAKVLSSKTYQYIRNGSKKALAKVPKAWSLMRRTEEQVKSMMLPPGTLFEELGFNYIGPIDGHDLPSLVGMLENIRDFDTPQLLHVVTSKGKGFYPAEIDPIGYHAITKIEPLKEAKTNQPKALKFCNVFGGWVCDMASEDKNLIAITPAMKEGSDLIKFASLYPDRYFDTAIAEQHAITFAAGLACEGLKPVVAIYSTFLQRGYDQLIHDVAIQNLDVLFAVDRAGLVGEDGPTHSGSYDIAYLRCIPNLIIMTPADEQELRQMLSTGYLHQGPAVVRYPRGTGMGVKVSSSLETIPLGTAVTTRKGKNVAILVFGTLLANVNEISAKLNATVVNMRFVEPLDYKTIDAIAKQHKLIVTVEDSSVVGGAGSAVLEYLHQKNILIHCINLGIPRRLIGAATAQEQLQECGLDASGIYDAIVDKLSAIGESTDFPYNVEQDLQLEGV